MSHDLALAIWGAVALGLVSCEVLARVTGGRYAQVRRLLHLLTATRPRTAFAFLGWMWIGWHLFAR
ncbi:MAG TPA: hypothetical protein VFN50_02915 [Acidimicrobiales bacterium]|nr:hypothetical protein [Acidimicrobiales bacterium]